MYFRSSTGRRFFLQFDLIVLNGGMDEISQSALINLIALETIDRSPHVATETRVEELVWAWLTPWEKVSFTLSLSLLSSIASWRTLPGDFNTEACAESIPPPSDQVREKYCLRPKTKPLNGMPSAP
jgi:hypothetical protein